MNYTQNYIHAAYSEILTGAPNRVGREEKITYKLSKKKIIFTGLSTRP